jgi:hypothetical protein
MEMRTGSVNPRDVLAAILLLAAACGSGSSVTSDGAAEVPVTDAVAEAAGDAAADTVVAGDVGDEAGRDAVAGDGPPADASADGGGDRAAGDAPPADAGALACGDANCAGDDLCVIVSTCPGAVLCTPLPDGGTCPAGTNPCPAGPGCIPVCAPPTSSCRPRPVGCGATLNCGCVCASSSCTIFDQRSVFCTLQ